MTSVQGRALRASARPIVVLTVAFAAAGCGSGGSGGLTLAADNIPGAEAGNSGNSGAGNGAGGAGGASGPGASGGADGAGGNGGTGGTGGNGGTGGTGTTTTSTTAGVVLSTDPTTGATIAVPVNGASAATVTTPGSLPATTQGAVAGLVSGTNDVLTGQSTNPVGSLLDPLARVTVGGQNLLGSGAAATTPSLVSASALSPQVAQGAVVNGTVLPTGGTNVLASTLPTLTTNVGTVLGSVTGTGASGATAPVNGAAAPLTGVVNGVVTTGTGVTGGAVQTANGVVGGLGGAAGAGSGTAAPATGLVRTTVATVTTTVGGIAGGQQRPGLLAPVSGLLGGSAR